MPAKSLLEQIRQRSLEEQFEALNAASKTRALEPRESLKLEQVVREMDRRDGKRKRAR